MGLGYVCDPRTNCHYEIVADTIHVSDDITEEDIQKLTHVFYTWVRKDDLLGPIFNGKIGTSDKDWEPHIEKINNFWSNIFLRTGRYHGQPLSKHIGFPTMSPKHFTRWLELFDKAGAKALAPHKHERFNQTAKRIAQSFQMALAVHYSQKEGVSDADNPFIDFGIRRPSWAHKKD